MFLLRPAHPDRAARWTGCAKLRWIVPRGTWLSEQRHPTSAASSMASLHRTTVRETALILAIYPAVIFGLAYRVLGAVLLAVAAVILMAWVAWHWRRHRSAPVAGLPPPPPLSSAPVTTPPRGRPGPGSGSPVSCAAALLPPRPPAIVDAVARRTFHRGKPEEVEVNRAGIDAGS